jgi:hypothetical protein
MAKGIKLIPKPTEEGHNSNFFYKTSGQDILPEVNETFNNPNASRWDKINTVLDPHRRIVPDPPPPPKATDNLAYSQKKKKKRKAGTNIGGSFGSTYGMKAGGKVKGCNTCRGMGAASRGGKFGKNG